MSERTDQRDTIAAALAAFACLTASEAARATFVQRFAVSSSTSSSEQ